MATASSYLSNIVTSLQGQWNGYIEAGAQRLNYVLKVEDVAEQHNGQIVYKGTHESGNRKGVAVTIEWNCMTEVVIRDAEALIEGKLDVLRGTMEGKVCARTNNEKYGTFFLALPSNTVGSSSSSVVKEGITSSTASFSSSNIKSNEQSQQQNIVRTAVEIHMNSTTSGHSSNAGNAPPGPSNVSGRNQISFSRLSASSARPSTRSVSNSKSVGGVNSRVQVIHDVLEAQSVLRSPMKNIGGTDSMSTREAARRKYFDAERKSVTSIAAPRPLQNRNANTKQGSEARTCRNSTPTRHVAESHRGSSTCTSHVSASHYTPNRGRSSTPSVSRPVHRNTIETHYQLRSTTERFVTPKKQEPDSALREWVDPRDIAARAARRNSPAKSSFGGTTPRFFLPGQRTLNDTRASSRTPTRQPAEYIDPRDIAYSLKPIGQRVIALPHRSSLRPGVLSTTCA